MTSSTSRTTHGRSRLYESVVDTIGDTPCIRVNNLAPAHVRVYVKAEFFNPAASVKDRLALNIIEEAERSGALKPGQTVVEATSGNTGIGLAMVCAAEGLSAGRHHGRQLLDRAAQADAHAGRQGGADAARRRRASACTRRRWSWPRPMAGSSRASSRPPPTPRSTRATTAREIIADFAGERLDYFVTGYGTGGTVTGVARVLRKERPETKIILCEPANAQLVGSGMRAGARRRRRARRQPLRPSSRIRSRAGRRTSSRYVLQEAIDHHYYDEVIPVPGPMGSSGHRSWRRRKASSPGSPAARPSRSPCRSPRRRPGSVILCMLPDTGERYLSTPLFDGIAEEMNEEETALSRSTPGFQMPTP